jgi:PAS domain S-box-containing protein
LGRFHLEQEVANAIVDAVPDAVLLIDPSRKVLFANMGVETMFGYGGDELVERSIEVLVPQGLGDAHRQDVFARRKDGSELPVEVSVSPARGDHGAFLTAIIRYASAPAVAAPAESLSKFGALFDETPEGIFLSDVDGVWYDANPAACQMLGYSREELVGRSAADLVPREYDTLIADTKARLRAFPETPITAEATLQRKDGTLIPVEVRLKFFQDGRVYAFVRDISERRRAQRERDETLCWMRAVLDQSPVGLALMHGPRFEHLEFNARAEQMLGRPWDIQGELRERLHGLDGRPIDEEKLPVVEALRGKRIRRAEYLATNSANGLTPIGMNAAPIVGQDGTVLGAVAAFEDISAPKELERLRAEWSAVVGHDLRQPLGTISFNAQLLTRSSTDPTTLKYAERIHAAATRLDRMVGDLMDLSRLEARRLELVRRRVNVPSVVRGCVERAELAAPDRPFDVRVEGEVPEACADPDRITQVLENLLTNAVKYGTAASPIVATVAYENGEVAVSVTNEGRALSAEEIDRIFERFQRGKGAKSEGIEGVGLGLYITRSLVEAQGGRITAASTPLGVNTFRFTLPVAGH